MKVSPLECWEDHMATMLENYRHRFGSAVKAQGNGFNGPDARCAVGSRGVRPFHHLAGP